MTYQLPHAVYTAFNETTKLYTQAQLLEAYQAGLKAQVRISIPTGTMEQEFQTYYRRGYQQGQRDMREAAAGVCDGLEQQVNTVLHGQACAGCASAIRALPLETL